MKACQDEGGGHGFNPAVDLLSVSESFAPTKGPQPVPSTLVLAVEASIAAAHRSLARARDHASSMSDLGLHDDLQLILAELEKLQVDLLRGKLSGSSRRTPLRVSQTRRIR